MDNIQDAVPFTNCSCAFKYGLEVPKSRYDILRIDDAVQNRKWQDAIEKEVVSLILHQYFDFKSPCFNPPGDFQYCRLHFMYDLKPDL